MTKSVREEIEGIVQRLLSHNTDRYEVMEILEEDYLGLCGLLLNDPEWDVRIKAIDTLVRNQYFNWKNRELVKQITRIIIKLALNDDYFLVRDKANEALSEISIDKDEIISAITSFTFM